ncbi:epsin-3 [Rhinophrynus dorsalis]
MATSSIRRQVKNIVHNYSEAEVKVREATSNDPWGPSATLMSEIAQMTYNVEAFPEVMMMVWRRLNDSGKNWRHVYKGLTLLDYLIKNGSNKVLQECHENIITVQTLKDFQFLDRDGKDQGINVREKAKQIVALLKDEERVKQERIQAQNTRRRISQGTMAISSSSKRVYNQGSNTSTELPPDLEQARPQSSGEEELQLQLALAMSREEAEKQKAAPSAPDAEEELQLQAALSQSKEEYEKETRLIQGESTLLEKALSLHHTSEEYQELEPAKKTETHLLDLEDVFGPSPPSSANIWDVHDVNSLPSPSNGPIRSASYGSLFPTWGEPNTNQSAGSSSLPWDSTPHPTQLREDRSSQSIIFGTDTPGSWMEQPVAVKSPSSDPWGGTSDSAMDVFGQPPLTASSSSQSKSEPSFDLDLFGESVPSTKRSTEGIDLKELEESLDGTKVTPRCRTPELFLDPAARSLVNLDSLISSSGSAAKTKNPFASGLIPPSTTNPFQLGDQKPSLNQMRTTSPVPGTSATPLMQLQNPSPVPTISMGPGLNTMQAVPTGPGFPIPTNAPLLLPLYSAPSALGIYPSLNPLYGQVPAVNQLTTNLSQPIQPQISQSGNNPFL